MHMIDDNGVYLMTEPVKLYVFKREKRVKLSFRVTDYCAIHRHMSIYNFQYICENWLKGVEGLETEEGKWYWYYSPCGPRPEQEPCEFVGINFGEWSFRINVQQMMALVDTFQFQMNNKMHWDD